jgi:hypothetical protein
MPISPHAPAPHLPDFLAMSAPDLLARYAISIERFDRRVVQLKDDQIDMAFLPDAGGGGGGGGGVGRWPVRILLGHLADAELAFVFRMRLVVAEDHPVFTPWDENAFIDNDLYGLKPGAPGQPRLSIGGPIAAIHTLRKWTAEWLRSLDPTQWERTGLHPERGEQSVRTILAYATWHLEHHARFLNAKVEKFLAPG